MAAIHVNWNPTDRQLRQFSGIAVVGLPLVGWLFSGRPGPATWHLGQAALVGGLAGAGGLLALAGLLRPRLVRPVYLAAAVLTFPLGLVLGEVILLLIWAIVFVPVALLFRLLGRDALDRTLQRDKETYWRPKARPPDVRSYYRQS